MTKRYTNYFNSVQLQTYSDAQIEFIAGVEEEYSPEELTLAAINFDFAKELEALA